MIFEHFRRAISTGECAALEDVYSPRAELEARLPGGPVYGTGPDEIVPTLGSWWSEPAEVRLWQAQMASDGGVLIFERSRGNEGARRQRHWIHASDGRITKHLVFSERSRFGVQLPDPGDEPSLLHRARRRTLVPHFGKAGSIIERAEFDDGRTLIVKHVSQGWGWLTRVTSDPGREACLWRDGMFDRLRGIDPAIVAVEDAAYGSRIFMNDVSEALFPLNEKLTPSLARTLMKALAEVHRACFEESMPYLSTLEDHIIFNSPRISEQERYESDVLPKVVEAGSDRLETCLGDELAAIVRTFSDDPSPLADKLRSFGTTLLHGDPKLDNMGLHNGKPVLIDWGLATSGPPAIDMTWMLSSFIADIDATWDEMLGWFKELWGDLFSEEQFGLGLVAEFVNAAWFFAVTAAEHPDPEVRASTENQLEQWVPRIHAALEQL